MMKFSRILRNNVLLGLSLLTAGAVQAQDTIPHTSVSFPVPRKAVLNVSSVREDYFPKLQNLEMPKPGIATPVDQKLLDEARSAASRTRRKDDPVFMQDSTIRPEQGINFNGNPFHSGIPNDNDMAISNGGKIVSVSNSVIYMFDTTGKVLKQVSLSVFSKPLGLKQNQYDPRALYDPESDRFILCYLNGTNDSTSYIIMAFSRTNDPLGDWNLYAIPGEPLKDTTWSDYPIIALTRDELFLTINSLQNDKSWQEGFRQSFIWQIDKNSGYNGDADLRTRLHSGIRYNGKAIRNLCPVQGGSGPAGPEMHFVSNRNFAAANDTFFLFTLTGSMSSNPHLQVRILKAPEKYGAPPLSRQPKGHTLETNDGRVLDALIEDGRIHLVGNTRNFRNDRASVYHGVISGIGGNAPRMDLNIIEHPYLDFGYPGIAYAGRRLGEQDMIIFLNHSGDTVNPGNSAVFYSQGAYSAPLRLKAGRSHVDIMPGKSDRWGDYCGTQLRYNQPGHVWVAGSYGYNTGGLDSRLANGTYISEVNNPSLPGTPRQMEDFVMYPSPATSHTQVQVEFRQDREAILNYGIYDLNGRLITELLNDRTKAGHNSFSFSTGTLSPGAYVLIIAEGSTKRHTHKFVVTGK